MPPLTVTIAPPLTSSLALAHELGHARQYYLKQGWFMGLFNKAIAGNSGAKLEIENDNLLTIESVVARQLGEGIRWEYGDCGSSRPSRSGDYGGGGMDPVLA